MKLLLSIGALTLSFLATPVQAQTQTHPSLTRAETYLYTGPDERYPLIESIPYGVRVDIYGCLETMDWCDVQWRYNRGWVPAEDLSIYSRNQYYNGDYDQGTYIDARNLPILTFFFNSYWQQHYYQRPWYRDHNRWNKLPPRQGKPRYNQHPSPCPTGGCRPQRDEQWQNNNTQNQGRRDRDGDRGRGSDNPVSNRGQFQHQQKPQDSTQQPAFSVRGQQPTRIQPATPQGQMPVRIQQHLNPRPVMAEPRRYDPPHNGEQPTQPRNPPQRKKMVEMPTRRDAPTPFQNPRPEQAEPQTETRPSMRFERGKKPERTETTP